MSLGAEIARLRIERGLRQKDLAAQLEVQQSHVARWENDMNRPRRRMLAKIAEALRVPMDALLAADQKDQVGSKLLEEQDATLVELLRQVHKLDGQDREALKIILQTMLTKAQMQALLLRPAAVAAGPESSKPRPRIAGKAKAG